MKRISPTAIALGATALMACLAAGCATHTRKPDLSAELSGANRPYEVHWQAAISTLKAYGFTVERTDRRNGMILTAPLTGAYGLEPWRKDAATTADLVEGSLQTLYRRAVVTIRKPLGTHSADAPPTVTVAVQVSRSAKLRPQITSTSDAYGLFGAGGEARRELLPDHTDLPSRTPTTAPAQPDDLGPGRVRIGDDPKLAAKILVDILRAAKAAG